MPEKIILEEDSTFVYYVDIEKGVVAAVMEHPIEEAMGYINRIGEEFQKRGVRVERIGDIIGEKLCAPIRAKATCHEEDDFDLEHGMELARKRCLAKYYKKLTKTFIALNDIFDPLLCFIEDNIISCASKFDRFKEYN
jgi:hypothetical protein